MKLVINFINVVISACLILIVTHAFSETILTGAGATLPAPVYAKWADLYHQLTGVKVNYQSIGSSGGVKQIISNTVDFGASDIPLSDEQLAKNDLFQFPTIIGGIVLAINIPGIKNNELVLDGNTLSYIYLGQIKKWNDAAITKLNPNLNLPNQTIAVIRRADGSGTSFVFTNYLSKVSSDWKKKVGIGSIVNWPVGLGGKGNDGVAAFIQRLPGSIGYVEYAYAKQNKLAYTKLINASGKSISPNEQHFSAAAQQANWKKSFSQDLTNQPGNDAWPITTTTFILVHNKQNSAEQTKEILKFFEWGYSCGTQYINALNYALLPDVITLHILTDWQTKFKYKSHKELINRSCYLD